MKKLIRYILLAAVIIFCALGLTGCNEAKFTLSTNLEIKEGGGGSRQMKLMVGQGDMKKILGGESITLVDEKIKEDCPAGLEYSRSESNGEYVFSFQMKFDSTKEYQSMAENISGELVNISCVEPESVFASGFKYEEDFTTRDLIGWVNDSLNGLLDDSVNLFSMITEETCSVTYKEKSYSVDVKNVVIDNLVETPVEKIDILTMYKQNQTADRKVIFTFSDDSMTKNGDAIKKYFETVCPEGSTLAWNNRMGTQICTVSESDMSAMGLDSFMKTLFSSEKTSISDQDDTSGALFDSLAVRNEYLDLTSFTYANNETVTVGYFVQWEDGMSVTVSRKSDGKAYNYRKADSYGGYQTVFEKSVSEIRLVTEMEAIYIISKIRVSTELKKNDAASRKIELCFAEIPVEKDQISIRKRIAAKAESYAEVDSTVELVDNRETFIISITQAGTISNLNEGFAAIFGAQGLLSHEAIGDLVSFKHDGSFSDTVDFTKFINNESYLTAISYSLKLVSGESILKDTLSSTCSLSHSEEKVESNKYSGYVNGAFMSLSFQTKTWNTDGVMLFVMILVCLVIIVVVFLIARVLSHVVGGNDDDDDYENDKSVKYHRTFGQDGGNAPMTEVSYETGRKSRFGRRRSEEESVTESREGNRTVRKKKGRFVDEEHITFGSSADYAGNTRSDEEDDDRWGSSNSSIPEPEDEAYESPDQPDSYGNTEPDFTQETDREEEFSYGGSKEPAGDSYANDIPEPEPDLFRGIETLGGSSLDVDPFSDEDDW